MDILRFLTAGSVDDGKSTLIGRLLYDSKSILEDQLEAIKKSSRSMADSDIDLALLTDGLRAEREQGITIDVAYKYFSTPKRKFIIADAPGHVQYTRNMVTGASNADLIIILIDARNGVVEQTRRHSIIASLLQIPHVVVAVNKMDRVNYSQNVYNNILIEYTQLAKSLGLPEVSYIPISALKGDNIVTLSENTSWYDGPPLLGMLEEVPVQKDINLNDSRFIVQYAIKPHGEKLQDYRGYAGKILGGSYRVGDTVIVEPSGMESKIKSVEIGGRVVDHAQAPQSVVLQLEDEFDVSRGDLIVKKDSFLKTSAELDALICWMDEKPLIAGNKYKFQIHSRKVKSVIKEIVYKLDVNTLDKLPMQDKAMLNDVVRVKIKTASPVSYDSYNRFRENGGAILIDETSNATAGACILL